jgi:phosphatidylethanolamine-binding protein (PEBP) family uncharacterized protein
LGLGTGWWPTEWKRLSARSVHSGIIARRSTGGLLEFTHHPEEKTMQLSSESFKDGAVIPGEFAFCVPAREGHVALSTNLNPQLAWAGAPPAPSRLR